VPYSKPSQPAAPPAERSLSPPLVPSTGMPRLTASLLVPAYNEARTLNDNLEALVHYLQTQLDPGYHWELIIVNDGSRDQTGAVAEIFAQSHSQVRVIHHRVNQGLGQAVRTGLAACQGTVLIPLDSDLSYAPEHIAALLAAYETTDSQIVVTSPYMPGGRVSNVPWTRLQMSRWANRLLSFGVKRDLSTLTGLVRAYDVAFLRQLPLRATGMDINPEIIYKARMLGARITEIPAHLHWRSPSNPSPSPQPQRPRGKNARRSKMRVFRHTWSILFYGFIFRPVMFFIIPSLLLFLLAAYTITWAFIHCWNAYQALLQTATVPPGFTDAIALAFERFPHTFMIGGITLMLTIQLFSLGVLSMQSKSYFEEIFFLGTQLYRANQTGILPNTGDPNRGGGNV
jgi:glycosyltransferase involved in cell wall biosynthesis